MRVKIVNGLLQIYDRFVDHMSLRTVFFAVSLIDRYTSTLDTHLRRSINPQLLSSTCIHIASKCEDVTYIGLSDLVPDGYVLIISFRFTSFRQFTTPSFSPLGT